MTHDELEVTGGVDTHGLTHHAAMIDAVGRQLADREFPATVGGYRDLLKWMRVHGTLTAVGVEGTGAYGAELARVMTAAGVTVVEVGGRTARSAGCGASPTPSTPTRQPPRQPPRCWPGGPPASPRVGTAWSRPSASCGSHGAARSRPAPRR
ncbi:transposase [Actinomadura luteofluorescens]|uniref:IS110 family transposase n=1 Tax=Actinomadura luteofluorescens TaxID=46163 RepID=UPI003640968D